MAQVLAPIVQTSSAITMPYPSSDAYQSQPTQPQQRGSQMPRSQMYNGSSGGTGYRGTSAPIAPYAFSSTPSLRQEQRSVSAPIVPQQPSSQPNPPARLGHPSHPSSSSDSTVSTSGSSNRSLGGQPPLSKDDSDARKLTDSLAPSIALSTSTPDLSLSVGDAPVKPSPGRYRRPAARTDSSSSIPTGASTPTQRIPSTGTLASGSSQPTQNGVLSSPDSPPSARPGHNRASSADDTQVVRTGGLDPAKRYRRRSFNGLEEKSLSSNTASLQVGTNAAEITASSNTSNAIRPASSSGRTASRPTSSHSHDRQGSAGSASSNASARSQVFFLAWIQLAK